jgi:hypothetical protein
MGKFMDYLEKRDRKDESFDMGEPVFGPDRELLGSQMAQMEDRLFGLLHSLPDADREAMVKEFVSGVRKRLKVESR